MAHADIFYNLLEVMSGWLTQDTKVSILDHSEGRPQLFSSSDVVDKKKLMWDF
jgi:hypothetical protein